MAVPRSPTWEKTTGWCAQCSEKTAVLVSAARGPRRVVTGLKVGAAESLREVLGSAEILRASLGAPPRPRAKFFAVAAKEAPEGQNTLSTREHYDDVNVEYLPFGSPFLNQKYPEGMQVHTGITYYAECLSFSRV